MKTTGTEKPGNERMCELLGDLALTEQALRFSSKTQ
jgi:hypothetical protein